jgi:uncharacterized membrane protein
MDYAIAMLVHRPYVVAVVVAYWVIAVGERGAGRAVVWFVTGTFVGWLVEASSVRTGFPFGMYAYHQDRFPDELWIADVPLFASLSFACLTYFGYSLAYSLLSRLERTPGDIQRVEDRDLALSVRVLLLATLLITWMDLVLDPVTHLGRYWALGDLYHYDPPGPHFDVPLSNYAGWVFTAFTIVFLNQTLDRFLVRTTAEMRGAFRLPYQPFWCLASEAGQYLFMLGVTLYLMRAPGVPPDTPLVGILLSGVVLTTLWAACVMILFRRAMARGARARKTSEHGGRVAAYG